MSVTSVIAGFSLFIFHLLFATSIAYTKYMDDSTGSSTYNLSRNKEVRITNESRNLFQINHGVFVTKENTSKSDVSVPKFAEKENVDPLLQQYLDDCTGYYTIQSSTRARMFYVFIKSLKKVKDPNIVLWLNGGPGYSSNIGLFYENGPFIFDNGFSLVRNTRGWDRMSNVIYVDQPIGTGFSYANNDEIRCTLDDVTNDLYNFLQEFFKDVRHQTYSNNRFFITGEGYAGHYAPALALKIIQEKNASRGIPINLIGVAIGNALTDLRIQYETIPHVARLQNLITEEAKDVIVERVTAYKASVEGCGRGDEMLCESAFYNCDDLLQLILVASGRNLYNTQELVDGPTKYDYSKMEVLLNQAEVKRLLGVPANKVFTPYNDNVFRALRADWAKSSQGTVSIILERGVKVLTYAGDLDLVFNYVGTMLCAKELQWWGQEGFKNITQGQGIPFMVDEEEKGLQFSYELLTHITVSQAGQMVLIDQPRAAFVMINRWMRDKY